MTDPLHPDVSVTTVSSVDISYDPAKRSATLEERGLDFADAARMFEGDIVTVPDLRREL
jgi:uncharacterized DUF497 family protein